MIKRLVPRIAPFALSLTLAFSLPAAESNAEKSGLLQAADVSTNFVPVKPKDSDGRIATLTARMLAGLHYSHQRFDANVSSKLFDRYLDVLDRSGGGDHLYFTQGDIAEFEHFRTKLGELTLVRREADTHPACDIFNRFMERLQQRVAYAQDLLQHENFTFDTDERIKLNRKDSAYPKDLDEAKELWKQRLRFEYLQEHLAKLEAKKKAEQAAKKAAKEEKPKDEAKPAEKKEAAKPKTEREEIVEKLSHNYQRTLHNFADWDSSDVLQVYLDTLAHVYDPHSDYMGPAPLDTFAINMNLRLFGIGAQLVAEDGYCTIQKLLPGGPAIESKKIKEKDRIIAVAQSNLAPVNVIGMRLDRAVQLIRGQKGTEVRLTVIPDGAEAASAKVVSLIRDEIKLEEGEAKARIIDMPNPLPGSQGETFRFGVINLPSFYGNMDLSGGRQRALANSTPSGAPNPSASGDVARLLKKLKQENVKGVILDLRGNGGGFLEEAIKLTGLFIKEGPVVQVRDGEGNIEEESDRDPAVLYDGPLMVLANRFSASASEIAAGALQDYGRAIVIGDAATHGKGTVQSVNPLAQMRTDPPITNDAGAVKVTVKKFYRASGASTQLHGVTPDIVLPSIFNESKEFGEAALENPLPYDTIDSAKYDHVNRVAPFLPELTKRSTQRVAASKDFDYVREDIALYKKQQADKSISLNEKQRLKEKDENEARQKAREKELKERQARNVSQEKVYELTLKLAEQPGLPPAATNAVAAKASAHSRPNGPTAAKKDAAEDEADEDKPAPVDPVFVEAERILVDYYSLLSKQNALTAETSKPQAARE